MPSITRKPGPVIAAFMLWLALALGACSSDNRPIADRLAPDSTSGASPGSTSPGWLSSPAPDNGAGIWLGSQSRDGAVVSHVSCLVTDAGDTACALYDPDAPIVLAPDPIFGTYGVPRTAIGGASGTLQFADASNLTGSGFLYAAPGQFLSDGSSTVAPFTISDGALTDIEGNPDNPVQKRLDLTISSLGVTSTLQAEFDHYYYREAHGDVSTDWIQGVYATFAIFDDSASLSIDPDGSLFSQTASGCVLSGHIGIIDLPYNGYASDLIMDGCPGLDGTYAGLAFLADFGYVNGTDNLLIMAFGDTGFIAGEARKYGR